MVQYDFLTAARALIKAIDEAIQIYGPDVTYSQIKTTPGCQYVDDNRASCVVGRALDKLDLLKWVRPHHNLTGISILTLNWSAHGGPDFSAEAASLMSSAQAMNDSNSRWSHIRMMVVDKARLRGYSVEDLQWVDGDIGKPIREVEMEPFPAAEPVQEPAAPDYVPEPVHEPVPEPEPVKTEWSVAELVGDDQKVLV